tara:strand:- start:77 stop:370 length:294 start_codon:yes stop_codon:yes gene_type:complete
MSKLKNCLTCRNGAWESDGDYGEYTYFTCEKREDDGYNNLNENLNKESYRKIYKRCFESMIKATCITCKDSEMVTFKPKDNYECFDCYRIDELENKE